MSIPWRAADKRGHDSCAPRVGPALALEPVKYIRTRS
jgi:hypothetical protein